MRVAAYIRVSTDRQAEIGQGLDVQRKAIRAWAKTHGHRIVSWFVDEGISGSNGIEDRVGLPGALQAVKERVAGGLIVARMDRLARLLTVQEAILAKVWELGGAIFTADTGEVLRDDPDDPMRTAMRQMAGVFAQLDRALIAKRLRDGRRVKGEKGGYAFGAPPLGYRAEQRELVPVADEQAALARVAELHARGLSLRAIGDQLDAEGITPKHGGVWHPETLRRVVGRLPRASTEHR